MITERNGTGIAWKERLKWLTRSYFQERVLSWERILNQECVSSIENRIYREELKESLGMDFFSPWKGVQSVQIM